MRGAEHQARSLQLSNLGRSDSLVDGFLDRPKGLTNISAGMVDDEGWLNGQQTVQIQICRRSPWPRLLRIKLITRASITASPIGQRTNMAHAFCLAPVMLISGDQHSASFQCDGMIQGVEQVMIEFHRETAGAE